MRCILPQEDNSVTRDQVLRSNQSGGHEKCREKLAALAAAVSRMPKRKAKQKAEAATERRNKALPERDTKHPGKANKHRCSEPRCISLVPTKARSRGCGLSGNPDPTQHPGLDRWRL